MNRNLLPEEQDHLELIKRLQEIHQLTPEDTASLVSIQARLFAAAPTSLHERSQAHPEAPSQPEPLVPKRPEQPRTKQVWPRHLELLASVLGVVLLIGTIVSMIVLIQGKYHQTIAGRKTAVPTLPTNTVSPTLVPAEPRTLVGKGTLLNSQNIDMVTSQVGWAFPDQSGTNAGPMLRTTDGGKHWQQVVLPQELSGQHFEAYAFDAGMAFILPLTAQAGFFQPFFYRTLDGGVTWQRSTWPPLPTPTAGTSGGPLLDWSFVNHLQGWVSVMRMPCCGGDTRGVTLAQWGGQTLYHTTDGGLTWRQVARFSFKYLAGDLTFATAQTGWITTLVDDPAHTALEDPLAFPTALYVTHDGGKTWHQQVLAAPLQGTSAPGYGNLTFFSATRGYLINQVSTSNGHSQDFLYLTQDGGTTWQIRGPALPTFGMRVLNDRYLFSSTTLFALVNGAWVAISNPPPGGGNTRVEFLSSLTGIALASTGDVYSTSDGGKTWQKISTLPG